MPWSREQIEMKPFKKVAKGLQGKYWYILWLERLVARTKGVKSFMNEWFEIFSRRMKVG